MRGYCLRLCRLLVFNIKSSQLEVLLEKSFLKELQKFIENTCIRFLVYSFLNFCQEKRPPTQFFCDIFDNSSLLKQMVTQRLTMNSEECLTFLFSVNICFQGLCQLSPITECRTISIEAACASVRNSCQRLVFKRLFWKLWRCWLNSR